jgi:GMP synthase PP-ATPase subunit
LYYFPYRISDLRKKDQEKIKLAQAQNDLETFIIDTQDKLYRELYEKCSTEEERENIRTKFSEASDWLYEQDENAERKVRFYLFSSL